MAEQRGSYFVYRPEGRPDAALSSLRRHVRGRFTPTTLAQPDIHALAHGTPGGAIALRPSATPAQMKRWRQDARDCRVSGRPPEPWTEAVFVGAKIIDWPPKVGRKWAENCVAEYERLFPLAKIVEAQLHTRETEWHVHVIAQPRGIDHKGILRCSKNAMTRHAIGVVTGEPLPIGGQRTAKDHKNDCSAIQDEFHRTCGAPFDLLRGVKGSKAKNTAITPDRRVQATLESLEELRQRETLAQKGTNRFKLAQANKRIEGLERECSHLAELLDRSRKAGEEQAAAVERTEQKLRIANHKIRSLNREVEIREAQIDKLERERPKKPQRRAPTLEERAAAIRKRIEEGYLSRSTAIDEYLRERIDAGKNPDEGREYDAGQER